MASETIKIKALDGHVLGGYLAAPSGKPTAGLLVLQEIFGVNGHMRHVTDGFAGHGFLALAPALFDRLQPNVELPYSKIDEGRALMQRLATGDVAKDLAGAVAELRNRLPAGAKVGVVGYCWGGAIADLAACRTDVEAAVSYYGRANVAWLDEKPRCPVQYHFGAKDPLIPPEIVDQIRKGRPGAPVFVYPDAGHGFSCDERPEFHARSHKLALERTLGFFAQHLGSRPAEGIDRRQLLTAAAGIAASLGIAIATPSPARAADRSRQKKGPFDSFRDYVQALEDRGLVMRVPRLDQDQYEMTALTYRLMDEFGWYGAPALLVEEIKQDGRWLKGPVITNHQGHWDTEAIIWGREPVPGRTAASGPETYRQTIKFLLEGAEAREGKTPSIPTNPVPPASAPVKEVVLRGEQCNVLDFAFIKSNPADSNRYVNTASVFTEDRELGMNFGTYRCEIKGPRLMGVNPEPGQQGWKMLQKKIERGEKRCPIALVMGNDPIAWFISSSVVSKSGADELAIAGGFRNKAVDVVKCETNDMLIPANAELVIEGEVLLDQMQPEGPFGEMYGYLGLRKEENFVMEVTCITHRKQPWILNQFTGVTRGFCTAPLEAFSFYRLKKSIPNAVAFHSPVEWTGIGILSIDKTAAGQGLEAGKKITTFVPITKTCIVVDKDVDVLNRNEVMQAVGARWQPYPGAEIIKEARGMALDPSSPKRPMSSKIVIDATRQLPEEGGPRVYPERNRDLLTKLAPESFDIVERKWDQYLKGWKRDA